MSSPTVTQPNPLSDGLSSLVLSKRYLACARPPHVYKLDHENCSGANDGDVVRICDDGAADCSVWPSSSTTVQARYEPSDLFTPLVFEEIRQPSCSPPPQPLPPPPQHHHHHHHHHHMADNNDDACWLRPVDQRIPFLPPPPQFATTPLPPPPQFDHQALHASGNLLQRRPLQHLPPPAQSTLPAAAAKPSSDHHHRRGQQPNGNKPGDLSWLVNFQVASIFEPTTVCDETAATEGSGGTGNVFGGEWQQPETLKQKKKNAKTEQKREYLFYTS